MPAPRDDPRRARSSDGCALVAAPDPGPGVEATLICSPPENGQPPSRERWRAPGWLIWVIAGVGVAANAALTWFAWSLHSTPPARCISVESAAHDIGSPNAESASVASDNSWLAPSTASVGVGTIVVDVKPWGTVFLDGERLGDTPFVRRIQTSSGVHVLRVEHPELGERERVVRIQPDWTVSFELQLEDGGESGTEPASRLPGPRLLSKRGK